MATFVKECSAILQIKIPQELKDSWNFVLPCLVGSCIHEKSMSDLGDSIKVMPCSIFKNLGLREPKPTRTSIQLVDRTIKYPRGIIDDVLVKVDIFIFPVDLSSWIWMKMLMSLSFLADLF